MGILAEKISEGKKIRIIGDYDVDGVVATYIFMETLLDVPYPNIVLLSRGKFSL